ncbi:hypothetical protein ACOME3_008597 [Neoechinorhynchus agilis]
MNTPFYAFTLIIVLVGSKADHQSGSSPNVKTNAHSTIEEIRFCQQKPIGANCGKGPKKHWTFDPATLMCSRSLFKCYKYGFSTENECIEKCGKLNWKKKICVKSAIPACRKNETRWSYKTDLAICSPSTKGQCSGVLNNFQTKDQCDAVCGVGASTVNATGCLYFSSPIIPTKLTALCKLPLKVGACKMRITRYYMNKRGQCRMFTFSGCGGNGNNFFSRIQCKIICEKYGLVEKRFFLLRIIDAIASHFQG